jgi:hypothetical protein
MAEGTIAISNIDLEKALGQLEEPPPLPGPKQTWESKNETLRSHSTENAFVVEDDDSDEESSKRSSAVIRWRD